MFHPSILSYHQDMGIMTWDVEKWLAS
jgi:hypothetical protein